MHRVRKQFVYTGKPMSRTTAWRRRKATTKRSELINNEVPRRAFTPDEEMEGDSSTSASMDLSQPSPNFRLDNGLLDENLVPDHRTLSVQDLSTVETATENADIRRCTEEEFLSSSKVNSSGEDSSSTKTPDTLCPCTESTAGDVISMCLALGIRHNLTWQAQVDMLKMVNAAFGQTVIPASKYKYFKELHDQKDCIEFHIYCNKCSTYLGVRAGSKGAMLCDVCEEDVEVSDPMNYFVLLPLEPQLSRIFQDSYLVDLLLTYRFNRIKIKNDALEDIYDGDQYKMLSKDGGILSSKYNFSYNFFTDGCPYGKSSGKTIWPIYISLNEFPSKERGQFICLVGLYVGARDPDLSLYLKPFVEHANKLSTVGFAWKHEGQKIVSKFVPLCAVSDSVARCAMLNRQSFHAYYGCTYCYHKTVSTRRGSRYVISQDIQPDRNLELLDRDIAEAYKVHNHSDVNKRHYKGVKGPTPLMNLLYFNVTTGAPVDYMHNICLGAIRTHMNLLLHHHDKKKFWLGMSNNRIGVAHFETAIDEILLKMQPPTFIPRTPRSITKRKLWKANEWLAWLLFYCVPCLINILEEKYVIHIALLAKATFLLLGQSISVAQVEEAHNLLLSYMYLFQQYFGESEMVYNIHLLSHVCKGVINYGPLWTHNGFVFEGQNRFLLQLCKSPNLLALQIAHRFMIYNSFPSSTSRLLTNEAAADFCSNLLLKRSKIFTRCGDAVLLGGGKMCKNLSEDDIVILKKSGNFNGDCLSFSRMLHKNVRYVCESYYSGKEKVKRNDSYLFTTKGDVVVVKRILQVSRLTVFICVETLSCGKEILTCRHPLIRNETFRLGYIREERGRGSAKWIAPNEILGPCANMNTSRGNFVCSVPFGVHTD